MCVNIVYVLDIRKLHMLSALDEMGTIAAVARSLHLTAPGISMQLASLEREVGLQLTERHGRTVALTPAGKLLAAHGREIVDRLSVAEMEATALREGAAGTYHLAAFPSAARTIVAHTWKALIDDPSIGITLRLEEMEPEESLEALTSGGVDLALTHSYSNVSENAAPRAGLAGTIIASEPVFLAVRADNDLAGEAELRGAADLRSFAEHDWVTARSRWSCYEMVQRACGLAGFTPRTVAEATDFAVQLALVSAGAGVALVPQLTVAAVPHNVRLLPLVAPVYRHNYVVVRQASEADAGIRRLRHVLAASAAALVTATAMSPVPG